MSVNITTNNFKFAQMKHIKDEIESNNAFYYLFFGDFIPHANADILDVYDIPRYTFYNSFEKMISGKLILKTDICYGIRYIPWENEKVFDMYDDNDPDLPSKDFYCITEEGSYFHIWKCLDNNLDTASTTQPLFSDIVGLVSPLYQTSDGYRWKYIATVDDITKTKFAVGDDYFPIQANSDVEDIAVPGSIKIVKVENEGRHYNNYIDGSFKTTDININGAKTLFNISNNICSTVNGYYTGCMLYVTSGASIGKSKTITNYTCNNVGNIIELDSQFSVSPQNGDTYQIRPKVSFQSVDKTETINCEARALINAYNSNSVFRIEVLNEGAGYKRVTARICANSIVGVSNTAEIRPILGPQGGHGSDCFNELYCHNLIVSINLSNTENNTIPAVNDFQEFGLLKNPLFDNVYVTFATITDSFIDGENVYKIKGNLVDTNCSVITDNTTIRKAFANFDRQISANQFLYVSLPDASLNQLLQVESVVNSTYINLTSNVIFTSNEAVFYSVDIVSNCVCAGISGTPNTFIFNNVTNEFTTLSLCIGEDSGAIGFIYYTTRNGTEKQYNTFNQMYKYNCTIVNGGFINGEILKQGNTSAYLHSITGDPSATIYVSSFSNGIFIAGDIVGNTSGAIATISDTFNPEISFGSGEIIYKEHMAPITRAADQTENFQIILNA